MSRTKWAIESSLGVLKVAGSRNNSVVAVHGLLLALASLVAEHRLQDSQTSVVVVHGLSCSRVYGIVPDRDRTHVSCTGR